jgi:hypothetical protein
MKREVGLWIDYNKAVIVTIVHQGDGVRFLESNLEKHVSFFRDSFRDGSAEDMYSNRFTDHFSRYYDDIIAQIQDADSIQIFGPDQAKLELEKRLKKNEELNRQIVCIETVDKMTDRQIEAKVWQYFLS